MIDFRKYLNCPDCRNAQPYCIPHRKEVDEMLREK
jgi:hypothetical protein